ncbi:MAG: YkgJ family cysteine cluster protein [Desulfovibrio sp.]|nr:YkgJ family cysteine cluster protein [Desulfovibrio sp.]
MLTVWTARSWWRRLLCLVTRQQPRVEGHCLQCGNCCREIVLCEHGKWIKTRRHFRRLMEKQPGYERMQIIGRDDDGRLLFSCSWLGNDGRCRCYQDRLPLCRNHPMPSLWLKGVDLPASCGYTLTGPSLTGLLRRRPLDQAGKPRFSDVLDREQQQAATSNETTQGTAETEEKT